MRRKSSITSWIVAVSTAIAMLSLTAWGLTGVQANLKRIEVADRVDRMVETATDEYTRSMRGLR